MVEVGVHEAKTTLSDLLRRVTEGEEVVITRSGEPVVRLVPVQRRARRTLGANDPLSDDVQRAFEGWDTSSTGMSGSGSRPNPSACRTKS